MIQARYGQLETDTELREARLEPLCRLADLHCHCLPNLDDGPASITDALALCQALAADGIDLAIATPHQLGRFESRTGTKRILETTRWLNQELANNGIDMLVLPGAEVRLDERISDMLATEDVLTLADMSRHLLLELPNDLFIDIEPLLAELKARNIETVIAHAERNAPLLRHLDTLEKWLSYGVSLQITAASLVGRFGLHAYRAAWKLVVEGWAAVIATDAHACQTERLCMAEAFAMVEDALGRDLATLLCKINPRRAAAGRELIEMYAWNESNLR